MTTTHRRRRRIILVSLLVIASVLLVGVAAVLIPILTHQSAGGSGQMIPDTYVSEVSAVGADGRTRTLEVAAVAGESFDPADVQPGESLAVAGTGFDAAIGIYVAICAIPEDPTQKPSPCLGGIPEGATTEGTQAAEHSSVWVSSDWAWGRFAMQPYEDAALGSFRVQLTVPEAASNGLDCTITRCAITTRADHLATQDRVQDLMIPIGFAQ